MQKSSSKAEVARGPSLRAADGADSADLDLICSITRPAADAPHVPTPQVQETPATKPKKSKNPRPKTKRLSRAKFGFLRRRPNWKHVALGALLLSLILAPLTMAVLFLCALGAAVFLLVGIGPQRIAMHSRYAHTRLAQRAPKTAERLRQTAERGVESLRKLLSRLPERLRDSFELPDLSEEALQKEDVALERLRRMAEEG